MNFALPSKGHKFENYLLPFELLFRNIYETSERDESLLYLKSKIKDCGLSSYRVYNKKDHRYENLSPEEYDAFLNLSKNQDIVIQKADKGNTVVLLDRLSYIKQMEELLSDKSKLKQVKNIFNQQHKVNKEIRHLLDIEVTIKSCLDDLLNNNYLSKEDYKLLKPCGSKPGIMYGLSKVHKFNSDTEEVPPFRPILSAIGTATYNLAKFIKPILKEYTSNEFTVRDSFSFCNEIQKQDSSLHMVSFDIKSLFTNIPLDETIDICVNRVFQNKRKIKGMLKRHFKQLLTHTMKSSCFVFNNIYYTQIDGVAMGSPLGPTFANLFLVYYEQIWLEKCPLQFKPKYYRRYVDDIFLMFE